MTNKEISLFICLLSVVLLGICITYLVYKAMNRKKSSKIINYKKNKNKSYHLYFLYKFYSKTPLLNRYFQKILSWLETVYPADRVAVISKATKDMTIAFGAALACGLTVVIISKGDMFYVCIGIVAVYVIFTQFITSQKEKLEKKLNEQFADFLTDVQHYYNDVKDVCDAIYDTLDDLPYEIGLHINRIYSILTSTHAEQEVTKYTDIAPNRFLMMFAAICTTIKENGDTKLDNGQWLFLNNLEYIKEELHIEQLNKSDNNYLFSGLKFVAIIPVFLLKPIEMWAVSNIPEMAAFYSNGSGTIVIAIVFALTLGCYQMICNLKDGRVDSMKENVLLNKMQNLPVIRRILTAEINRNYSKALRVGDELKTVGENIGPKGFLLKRYIYGFAMAIAFTVIMIFSQSLAKDNLMHDFSDAFDNSIVPNSEYRESMRLIGEEYMGLYRGIDHYEEQYDNAVSDVVRTKGIRRTFAEEIITEVFARLGNLEEIYYKWYMAIGTIAAFFLGFFIPVLLLKYQLSIMRMSMEDEVVQFQTIALIMSHISGITINSLLEWMERFAFCFKNSISECIINLEYSVQGSIEKMKDKEPFPPFKRFCDNLLSIDNIGIAPAFESVAADRAFSQKRREQDNNETVNKKASIGRMITFVPLIAALGGYMVLPFGQMALKMMNTLSDAVKVLG